MTITVEAVTALVGACRRTIALSDIISAALGISVCTELDTISAEIEDALCIMRGENANEDLEKTITDRLIRETDVPCEDVAKQLCEVIV